MTRLGALAPIRRLFPHLSQKHSTLGQDILEPILGGFSEDISSSALTVVVNVTLPMVANSVASTKSVEAKKEEYKKVLKELKSGTSVRKTAKLCDVSVSTVQRLKKEFCF